MGISVDELISYVERALDEMAGIATGLGDDLANQRPDLPGRMRGRSWTCC